ncbi:hypothetical protein ACFFX0_29390 [Citricoccus parietis]|uniref:Uncharacterized protein n=1 Tax=Citricoccus parietis TaxID=592307 RepID=A0ABV5G9D9_9MICC
MAQVRSARRRRVPLVVGSRFSSASVRQSRCPLNARSMIQAAAPGFPATHFPNRSSTASGVRALNAATAAAHRHRLKLRASVTTSATGTSPVTIACAANQCWKIGRENTTESPGPSETNRLEWAIRRSL